MADSGNIGGSIISELGQIGKQIGTEVAKVPKDIAGKALESLGTSSSKNSKGQTVVTSGTPGEGGKPATAWEQIDGENDQAVKRHMARRALEELTSGAIAKKKEPSIWERLQQEQEQKKNVLAQNQAQQSAQSLPMATSKRPRGDLYGKKAKQTATENRNVRQD
ncbi:MAG TPA: hypothetical protein VMR81_00900 [Patescibacteria group bacterium]|jgi:hypothetical protein|nr:hypothetical protein [Patescibacteria group bacterium]